MPPNDKHGRVQTSTITVAVMPEPEPHELRLLDRDVEITTCRSSGAGGQHVNKVESAVMVKHLPTGMMVRCEGERSQHQNRATAMATLRARLWEAERTRLSAASAASRRVQVGSGMRGDKRRTIRVQDGTVHDHVTRQRWGLRDYMRGSW